MINSNSKNQHKNYGPFTEISYEEVLERLDIPFIFDEYEVEDYAVPSLILLAEGDVHLTAELPLRGWYDTDVLLVVIGSLLAETRIANAYYVTGDVTVDYLRMDSRQRCLGKEKVLYVQEQMADDHEALCDGGGRLISAPLFISWFYDLASYRITPETTLFALYEKPELNKFKTDNFLFRFHLSACALKPELCETIEEQYHDGYYWFTSEIYAYLKAGKSIYIDGFDVKSLPLYEKGMEAFNTFDDKQTAFLYFKELIRRSPNFHPGYLMAGRCLYDSGDWAAAKSYFKKGIETLPQRVQYTGKFIKRCLQQIEEWEEDPQQQSKSVEWIDHTLDRLQAPVRDQGFWNSYFDEHAANMYNRDFADHIMEVIPEEFRTVDMLRFLLVEKDANGTCIKYFSRISDEELIILAVRKDNGAWLGLVPAHHITREVVLNCQRLYLSHVPEHLLDREIYLMACQRHALNYKDVPEEHRDHEMAIAAIAGGAFLPHEEVLPPEMENDENLIEAVSLGIDSLREIPTKLVSEQVYEHALSLYHNHPEWKDFVAQHSRELPDGKRNDTDERDMLNSVWACFWDEAFLINVLRGSGVRQGNLYDIPSRYITPAIAEAAVQTDRYAITYIPLHMRTKEICAQAFYQSPENMLFIPEIYLDAQMCIQAIIYEQDLLAFVPYKHYVAIFEAFLVSDQDLYHHIFCHLMLGVGQLHAKDYPNAIKTFDAVVKLGEGTGLSVQKASYLAGWCHFAENRLEDAQKYFQQSTALAQGDEWALLIPYEDAVLDDAIAEVMGFYQSLNL